MKLLSKLLLTAALTTSFAAAPAMAGPFSMIKDKAKAEAKKEAEKEIKRQAKEEAKKQLQSVAGVSEGTAETAVDGTEKVLEMTGVIEAAPKEDNSLTGKAFSLAKDSLKAKTVSDDELVEEALKEMAKEDTTVKKVVITEVTTIETTEETVPAAPAPLPPVNCPEGTTAQDDGTCMITGDFGL